MKDRILVITQQDDLHVDAVFARLRALGHEPLRLHNQDIPLDAGFSMSWGSSGKAGMLRTKEWTLDIERIRSIWWRKPMPNKMAPGLSKVETSFAKKETAYALDGLWRICDCYWMSSPSAIKDAGSKPEQLQRAFRMGFDIPRTLITCEADEVWAFFEQCDRRMIFKTMTDPAFLCRDRLPSAPPPAAETGQKRLPLQLDVTAPMTYTTMVTEESLRSHLASIRYAPCQFQEYVDKLFEYRVTIIGEKIFVAQINSQAQERTRVDWRHYDVPMLIRKSVLPSEVSDRCLAFVRSYGLEYSALDLIQTPDNRYVFLENNPNGQWGFIDAAIPAFGMAQEIAVRLADGKKSTHSTQSPPLFSETLH